MEWLTHAIVDKIAMFGSTRGDTANSGWRTDQFLPGLQKRGVNIEENPPFNPVVDHWSEADAIREVEEFLKDRFLAFYIANSANSITSLIELGAAEWASLIRGQEVFILIQGLAQDTPLSRDAARARGLIHARVEAMKRHLGDRLITATTMDELIDKVADAYLTAKQRPIPEIYLEKERQDLMPTILVTGSSGMEEPAYQKHLKSLLGDSMTSTWSATWDDSPETQLRESALKERAAVKVHCITNDTTSLGALAEAYALAVEAYENGQRIAIVLEDGWKNPDWTFNMKPGDFSSEAEYAQTLKDARNARTALVAHFERFCQENPNGISFILSNDLRADIPRVAMYAKKSLEDLVQMSADENSQ